VIECKNYTSITNERIRIGQGLKNVFYFIPVSPHLRYRFKIKLEVKQMDGPGIYL